MSTRSGVHEILLTIRHPTPLQWVVSCEEPYCMIVSPDKSLAIQQAQHSVMRQLKGKHAEIRFEAKALP